MTNTKDEQYAKILDTLKTFGRMPTARLSAIAGINYFYMKELLEELLKESKVIKIEETLATYWEINIGKKDGKEI